MKLGVNMYVRTKRDGIGKIISLSIGSEDECCFIELSKRRTGIKEHNIIKASHNIIDLIEKNDFVNGHRVIQVDRESLELDIENSMYGCGCETIDGNKDIKSILTKEMFESMKYEVE